MSADGHGGFATTSAIGITVPNIEIYAIAGLLLGLLMAGGGTTLLIRSARQSSTSTTAGNPIDSAASARVL